MINTHLIAHWLQDVAMGDKVGKCKMCGCDTETGFAAKDYIKEARFTNSDLLKCRSSEIICENCAACLKEPKLRRSSFICSEKGLQYLTKNDIENVLFNMNEYVEGEFVVCITQSFKKHNSFRARVNSNTSNFFIREEDDEYIFDVERMREYYGIINELYLYFTKEEIRTGQYDSIQILKYFNGNPDESMTLDNFFEKDRKIAQIRGSKQFDLLLHILNSEKRNEIVKARIKEEKENGKKRKN